MSSLVFVSVPPLSVSFLFLAAGSVAMTVSISTFLVLAIAIPFFVTAQGAMTDKSEGSRVQIMRMLIQACDKYKHTTELILSLSTTTCGSWTEPGLTWCSL